MAEKRTAPKLVSKTVIDRFKQGLETTKNQRDRERAALKFMDPKFQWDPSAIAAREGMTVAGSTIPARPMISVSKIAQPIQLVQNGFQNANLDVNIHPVSPGAEKKTAEIFQGIYRAISRDSNAILPRSWAFARGTEAGFGCYRILTEYDYSSDDSEDQKIVIKRIRNQEAVIFDPAAEEPDYCDARYLFITSWVPLSTFKDEYPKAKLSKADESALSALELERPEWVDVDNDQKGIQVAEYFSRRSKADSDEYEVFWYKVCAAPGDEVEELDSRVWEGQYIPVVPVIGNELQPFDKERRYQGIVEPAMDAQKGFNYAITTALEIAALEPKAPFIGAEGSFEGHESKWNQINTRNWGYVEYKPTRADGGNELMPPPQRMQIDANRLSVSMQLAQMFDQAIQATTYTPDPALGKHSRDESGKAIEALQGQSMASTSNYMSNMAQISMMYEAKVIMDMIPRLYNRPGRVVRIVDVQDETEEVMLNQPFVTDPNTGRPTANLQVQPNQKPMIYDLTKGRYGVAVSVGKSYQSRFDQGKDQLTQLLQADPALMPVLGDIYFKYNDAPWSHEAEQRMKKVIEKTNPDFFKPETPGSESPEQLRAMLQAATGQLQQLQQQLQMAMQAIEQEKVKQQATLEKANIDAQSKMQTEQSKAESAEMLAQMDARLKVMIEQIQTAADEKIAMLQEAAETERQERELQFKAIQAQLDRQQEQELARYAADQARANAEQAHAHEAGMSAQDLERIRGMNEKQTKRQTNTVQS